MLTWLKIGDSENGKKYAGAFSRMKVTLTQMRNRIIADVGHYQ